MKKSIAIKLLGPTTEEAGRRIGCSGAAIRKWPEDLPQRLVDRVIAAAVRSQVERTPLSSATGRITLPSDLFAYLWHEAVMARAERARQAEAATLARRLAAHNAAKRAAKSQQAQTG